MVREGCELLETLSKTPLILVLEDLHWSDHATLDFLSLLAQRHVTSYLMVLATYCPLDASQQTHPVTEVHRDLQLRGICSEVALEPFSRDEVKRYLTRRCPGTDIPNLISQSLFIRTGGHPLFISNLIEYLIDQNQWSPLSRQTVIDTALPETIRRVIEREIERLSPDEQGVLSAASVAGMRFSVNLLCGVLGMEIAEADRCCNALVRRGQILVSDGMEQSAKGDVAGYYAFRHALYCEKALSESVGAWADFVSVHCSAILGKALHGLKDHAGAIQCFDTFFQAEKNNALPIFSNYFFPACLGAGETWLALGKLDKARHYAQRLYDLSSSAPERTYLALSHRLFAEIAIMEESWDEAHSQITEALEIVENTEIPLAAWKVYATGEKLYHRRDEAKRMGHCRSKKQDEIDQLLNSLQTSDPLREHLLNLAESHSLSSTGYSLA